MVLVYTVSICHILNVWNMNGFRKLKILFLLSFGLIKSCKTILFGQNCVLILTTEEVHKNWKNLEPPGDTLIGGTLIIHETAEEMWILTITTPSRLTEPSWNPPSQAEFGLLSSKHGHPYWIKLKTIEGYLSINLLKTSWGYLLTFGTNTVFVFFPINRNTYNNTTQRV